MIYSKSEVDNNGLIFAGERNRTVPVYWNGVQTEDEGQTPRFLDRGGEWSNMQEIVYL